MRWILISWGAVLLLLGVFAYPNFDLIRGYGFWTAILFLVMLSAFFSASETAFTILNSYLHAKSDKDDKDDKDDILVTWMNDQTTRFVKSTRRGWSAMKYGFFTGSYDVIDGLIGEKFYRTLAVVLIMNNVVNIGGVTFVGIFVVNGDGKEALIAVMTIIPILVFGEIFAKTFALRYPILVAVIAGYPTEFLTKYLGSFAEGLTEPITRIFEKK